MRLAPAAVAFLLIESACVLPEPVTEDPLFNNFSCTCTCTTCLTVGNTCGAACPPAGTPLEFTDIQSPQTSICEDSLSNAQADCATACANLPATQLAEGASCPPSICSGPSSGVIQDATSTCTPVGDPSPVIGGGVLNSFVLDVGSGSTIFIQDNTTGSSATANAQGNLSYTVDGQGDITLNLISLHFASFNLDLVVAVNNLIILNEGPASGLINGTQVDFPPGSLLVSVSGDTSSAGLSPPPFGHTAGEPSNDADVQGVFDPASNSFNLRGTFNSSSFGPGGKYTATLSLQGTYKTFSPVSVAGGPYQTECNAPGRGTVHVDGSGSTDGNGQTNSLAGYVWLEGTSVVGLGQVTDIPLSIGRHQLDLRVFNEAGEYADSLATATVVDTAPPIIQSVTDAQACVWPPNDKLLHYALGTQIAVQVQDICDPNPTVSFVGGQVEDRQAPGRRRPPEVDLLLSADAFCLRAEEGNRYAIAVQAKDSAGLSSNVVTATIEVATGERRFTDEALCHRPAGGGSGDCSGGRLNGGDNGGSGHGGGNGHGTEGGGSGTSNDGGEAPDQCCSTLPPSDFLSNLDPLCAFGDAGIAVVYADAGPHGPPSGSGCTTDGGPDLGIGSLLALAAVGLTRRRRK